MRVNNKKITNNIVAENEETLVESSRQKEKKYGRKAETDKEKRKKFQWTKEMIEYLLDSLKRYKVMCSFSRKDFDADKTVQNSKLRKEMAKKYEVLLHLKLLLTQELIYRWFDALNTHKVKS